MITSKIAGCSWSGGKDSCFALMQAKTQGYSPAVLLNVLNEDGKISRSHGIPSAILLAQAESANLPIKLIESSWQTYETKFTNALRELKEDFHLTDFVFGDIDLQAHRDWEEKVCKNAGLNAVLPLWKQDRRELIVEMINSGIETMIVSCNTDLGESFLGKIITADTIEKLDAAGVDVCGENGEFHTLVLNCPLFTEKISVKITGTQLHGSYWFSELQLTDQKVEGKN